MNDASREAAPPKEDPETLVLRGSPRPVVRFRRGLIIGITGAVAACLMTLAWVALEPPSFRLAAGDDGGAEPLSRAAPEALAGAPANYGDVPLLGPPLPGDLGRPILEHRRSMAEEASPPAAQVTEHVRDSATGRTILVPQGARLIGSYDSAVAYGQRRALLVWQRIVFPDGSSVRLDNTPATDAAGYAGVADEVDFHTWRLLKGIALSTLLGVGTELTFGSGESDLVQAIRGSMQQNAARAGDQITQRNLDVQPTLRVRPGWPLRAVIHKDLVLWPWRG